MSASRGSALREGVHQGALHVGGSASRRGQCLEGLHPGSWVDLQDTMGYSQLAGGTHPTGMRSCFSCLWLIITGSLLHCDH